MFTKKPWAVAAIVIGLASPSALCAAETPAAAAEAQKVAKFSVADTDIGTLLDNPATKAILDRHLPEFGGNPQIAMARPMTLKQIQSFAADMLTDEVLANIDADLANVK